MKEKQTKEERAAARAARRAERMARYRDRMAGVFHRLFGQIGTTPALGTVFDPLACFYDPGFFAAVMEFWRWRAARAGVGSGLPADQRRAAVDEAGQRALRHFTDRDYAGEGYTADDRAMAILSTAAYMDRCHWREDCEDRQGRGDGNRKWFPYNRAMAARVTDAVSPDRLYAAAHGSAEDLAILLGIGTDEVKTGTADIAGGRYRPWTHGRMVRGTDGFRMEPRRGTVLSYGPDTATTTVDVHAVNRHHPTPPPTAGIPATPETEGAPGSGYYRQGERREYVMSLDWFAAQCERHGID